MTNPKVSLIVTYNNVQNEIKSCIESILNQTFKDFELICVNNASTDSSEQIVLDLTQNLENVKRMSLPSMVDDKEAQTYALALSSGDFVCFLDSKKVIEEGVISTLFAQAFSIKNNAHQVLTEKMYKREFLENMDTIETIIEDKINVKSQELKKIVSEYESFINDSLDKNAKANIENVSNRIYEITCRFNQLEKNMYDRAGYYNSFIEEKASEIKASQEGATSQIYTDMSKVYDFVNSEVDKKGSEINKVYEEISGNYKYTETIVSQLREDLSGNLFYESNSLKERLDKVEKDLVLRHVSLKRLFDIQLDEVDSKIKALSIANSDFNDSLNAVEASKILEENIEKIYSHINKTNSQFYEELTKIYKEINDKLIAKMKEQQYSFDKKIDELKVEFNQKIETLGGK